MRPLFHGFIGLVLWSFFPTTLPAQGGSIATPGEWRQSLDGEWHFTTDAALVEQPTGWDKINVPGNWDTLEKYATYKGKGWYRRTFSVPQDWRGKRTRLRFEAVYHEAGVTLNGQPLGTHVGGYTPFEFDVTAKLNYGGTNTVTVCADNTYHRGAWWPWGGISRSVSLIANQQARIVWQHIHTEPDLATGTARVFAQYKLANASAAPLTAALTATITAPGGQPAGTWKLSTTIPANAETLQEATFALPASVRLWDFDHPNLYALTTDLRSGSDLLHAKTDRFGIRKVEITPEGLLLNGERIRVPGFDRVSDSTRFGNTEPDALVRKDVDLMKSAGAVFSRLMHTPQAPNLLDYLDEKGMMIFCEIPVWGWDDLQKFPGNPLAKQWLREMIERDFNHPCIVGWSTGNELGGHYAYVASMNDYVRKELDPYRLVGHVSNTAARSDYGPKNDPVTVSDLAMINQYGNPAAFTGTAGILRSRWPDKPVFFSEYGAHQIGASPGAKIPGLEQIWANISKSPFVIGGALWTFNDYRSGMQGTPPSGNREWGVVDVDRRPKAAYQQVRKLYSPVHSLEITAAGTISLQPRSRAEIPSYTLRGYHLDWKLSDASGAGTSQGKIALPDLAPDAPTWTGMVPGASGAAAVSVSLITPGGYDVDGAITPSPGTK